MITNLIADVFTILAISAGGLFFLAGSVGLLRFPDTFTRLHALTKADNLGLGLVVLGLLPQVDSLSTAFKLMLIWLLVLLRMVQGFSTGGEYGGAATFMAEYAPDRKRGFFGSFLEFGTLGGFALGTAVMLALQLMLGEEAMMAYGWRIPFFLALPMGLIGLYLRSKLEDTPVFQEMEEAGEAQQGGSLKELVMQYWRPMLTMTGLVIALVAGIDDGRQVAGAHEQPRDRLDGALGRGQPHALR